MKKPSKRRRSRPGQGVSTRAIHAGEDRERYADSITTPIVQTSTYAFKDTREIEAYTKGGKERFEYGRYGNPTETVAQRRLAALEGAEDCVVFSSGMSAIVIAPPEIRANSRSGRLLATLKASSSADRPN